MRTNWAMVVLLVRSVPRVRRGSRGDGAGRPRSVDDDGHFLDRPPGRVLAWRHGLEVLEAVVVPEAVAVVESEAGRLELDGQLGVGGVEDEPVLGDVAGSIGAWVAENALDYISAFAHAAVTSARNCVHGVEVAATTLSRRELFAPSAIAGAVASRRSRGDRRSPARST